MENNNDNVDDIVNALVNSVKNKGNMDPFQDNALDDINDILDEQISSNASMSDFQQTASVSYLGNNDAMFKAFTDAMRDNEAADYNPYMMNNNKNKRSVYDNGNVIDSTTDGNNTVSNESEGDNVEIISIE